MSLVLVADDEPAVLEVLTEVVEDLGHEVVRAHDGREALQIARAQRPQLVVTDHMMPRLSGVELCRAMRNDEALSQVPVILLSAALPPEATEAYAYLAKPFELDEFEALVKRTLDGLEVPTIPAPIHRVTPVEKHAEGAPSEELVHWVAHELKTPLSAAKVNLQLLERRIFQAGHAPERHQFTAISRQLEMMELLVDSLLDSSRIAEGQLSLNLEEGDLRGLIQTVVGEWRELHPDFQFELVLPESPVKLRMDSPRMTQILSNLIANAVKFGAPPKQVRIALEEEAGRAKLHVQDFGPGIPSAQQKTIFQRFRPAEEGRGKGHGQGLYLASELARLHGGEVTVKSALGQGATFSVTLPVQ